MHVIVAAAVTVALVAYAWRPAGGLGRLRLAIVRGCVITGAGAVAGIEVLSWCGMLTATGVGLLWLVLVCAAVTAAALRFARDGRRFPGWRYGPRRAAAVWAGFGRLERGAAVVLLGVIATEFVLAVAAEPNNYDSQTYHLPKIEHWAQNGSVEFFATRIHRQVSLPPGAEYLLAHLRLASGGDAYYNFLQFAASLGCLLIVSRICAQLGGGRRAQLLTMVLLGLTPMVVLQATSTQVDLVTAAWTGCVATIALDGLRRRARMGEIILLGAATGLIAITKTNGLLAAGPILVVWGLAQLRLAWLGRHRLVHTVQTGVATVVILALAFAVAGPYLLRVMDEFGHPLGPDRVRESIPMQTHDPASVFVNVLRIGQTALDAPGFTEVGGSVVITVAEVIGVDPQDDDITFQSVEYPQRTWHPDEDKAAFPITGLLVLIGFAACLARAGRLSPGRATVLRAYAIAIAVAFIGYAATVKWQPWGNRLLLFALVLAVPMAGLWLDAVLRKRWRLDWQRKTAVVAVVCVLAPLALSAVLSLGYGMPRRLVGWGATLTTSEWDTRFVRSPERKDDYLWAAKQVDESGAQRVGLVQMYDSWEYPWWKLLPGREIVPLQSVLPKRPPGDPDDVDAIVCSMNEPVCAERVPDDWEYHYREYAGYALPPD